MDSKTGTYLTLVSRTGADIAAQLDRLGWNARQYSPTVFCPDAGDMMLIDARISADLPVAIPECGIAIAITGHQTDYGNLIAGGVTYFLPWPCDDALLDATITVARAALSKNRSEDSDVACDTEPSTDGLTGLMSRSAARTWLNERLGDQSDDAVSLCMIVGISQFASVNAAYGKNIGDTVLARAALRINNYVKQFGETSSIVARMGGTDYLVAMTGRLDEAGGSEISAEDIARLILSSVSRPFVAGDQVIRLTARCGIAEPVAGDDVASLLRRANAALADARRSATSEISIRSGRVRAGRTRHDGDTDRLDADLRLALGRGEIGIVYQPQYNALTDRIMGVEALARWNHPVLGQLNAATLFEAADRSDYLLPLSQHIQRAALEEAGRWPASLQGLRLSINVTAADLAQENFVSVLLDMIDRSGFPRGRLTIEITESGLIENIDRAATILRDLRGDGLCIAIDDFGTGYSSLAYLKALHPDYLKIDQSLSHDILGTPRDRIILRAIIAMARSLALTVIAEGVESEQQLTLLAREGCDIYQGFLRSAALTGQELVQLVENS